MQGSRWCFTINNPRIPEDFFWEDPNNQQQMTYVICQEEVGEEGTRHIQGFLILKRTQRLSWLKNLNPRAHWERARGTNQQASDYCNKDDTHPPDGYRFNYGEMPTREAPKRNVLLEAAIQEVDDMKEGGYKRPADISTLALLAPGFTSVHKLLNAACVGPYRPNFCVITMVGPPGCGKSFAAWKHFPNAGRAVYGNSGLWFINPTASCMLFDEFCGQIKLTDMNEHLDKYPYAIEIKGGMVPALYNCVIITTNTKPSDWYKADDPAVGSTKRTDALAALYDRIGYDAGWNRCTRENRFYICPPAHLTIQEMREYFDDHVKQIIDNLPWQKPSEDQHRAG